MTLVERLRAQDMGRMEMLRALEEAATRIEELERERNENFEARQIIDSALMGNLEIVHDGGTIEAARNTAHSIRALVAERDDLREVLSTLLRCGDISTMDGEDLVRAALNRARGEQ